MLCWPESYGDNIFRKKQQPNKQQQQKKKSKEEPNDSNMDRNTVTLQKQNKQTNKTAMLMI